MNIQFGDIITMTSFTLWTPNMQAGFKAPKGEAAVFLLLGNADKKNLEAFNHEAALNRLGWSDGPAVHDKHIHEYEGDVFVVFDPTDDGASILGACRTLVKARALLAKAGGPAEGFMDYEP